MKNVQLSQTPRDVALHHLDTARKNLLLMIVLTVVNVALFFFGSETMMLFSATVPYYAVGFGYYSEDSVIFAVGIAVAVVGILLYLLCWILSKKNYVWMSVALVLFAVDSAFMAYIYIGAEDISGILDVLIHIWVLYYLVIGVKYGRQLKKLPLEEETTVGKAEEEVADLPSSPLRRADTEMKSRILIEGEFAGHYVCYRRVKRTNELVIDGYVYDELEMLVEPPHELSANLNGTSIVVGYNGTFSYITVDGEQVAKKIRLM